VCLFVCVCVCPSRMRFAISASILSPLGSFSSSLDKAHFLTTFLPRPRFRGSKKGQKLSFFHPFCSVNCVASSRLQQADTVDRRRSLFATRHRFRRIRQFSPYTAGPWQSNSETLHSCVRQVSGSQTLRIPTPVYGRSLAGSGSQTPRLSTPVYDRSLAVKL